MNRRLISALPLSVLPLLMLAGISHAQQSVSLNLFQDVERQQVVERQPVSGPVNTSPRGTGPQFVLVGTSRFGDRHQARLRSQSGEVIAVTLDPNGSTPIPGHPGYQIADSGARHLVIQHPANVPCTAAADQGVSCSGSNIARLQLATAQPVQPVQEPERHNGRGAQPADQGSTTSNDDSANQPDNPFAAALRAARERGEADPAVIRAEAERFLPRRIDPSEVPAGARVIRTPFGDRIVTDQN